MMLTRVGILLVIIVSTCCGWEYPVADAIHGHGNGTILGNCNDNATPVDPYPIKVYALAGQSNMTGGGTLAGAPAVSNRDRIKLFGNDYVWHDSPSDPIDSSVGQVDSVSLDANPGVGPGLYFASRLLDHPTMRGKYVALVTCAKSGSAMASWHVANPSSRGTLYGSCVYRIKQALTLSGTEFKGWLFYQGESDTDTQVEAEAWSGGFNNLQNRLSVDFGGPVNIILVKLPITPASSNPAILPYWSYIRDVQATKASATVTVVDAPDGPYKPDYHLEASAQKVLGERMSDAILAP